MIDPTSAVRLRPPSREFQDGDEPPIAGADDTDASRDRANETLVLVIETDGNGGESTLPEMSVEQLDATLAHVVMPEEDDAAVAVVIAGATAPPRTVTAGDIEAAFHRAELAVEARGLDVRETTVLLLKSGLAYLGLRSSPLDLRLPADDEATSAAWTRWRSDGRGGHEIASDDPDVWHPLDGVRIDTRPMTPAEAAGTWQRVESTRLGPTAITVWSGVTLDDGGGFRRDTSRLTTIDADHFSPFGVTSSFRRDVTERGGYALLEDGMTIEFRNPDGYSYRELFYRAGDAVIVGDRRLVAVPTTGEPDATADGVRRHGDTANWLAVLGQIEDERAHEDEEDRDGRTSRRMSSRR